MKEQTASELTLDDLKVLLPPRPYASVKLPSLGLFYNQNVVKDGSVELCPLSAREEKLIAGIQSHNVDDIIDTLIRRCMKTEMDPDDLLVTDRFYLLMMLRANSYGEEYGFEIICDKCKKPSRHTVNIPSSFEITWADPKETYPFAVELPQSKLAVTFRLLTGKDAKSIRAAAEKDEKKNLSGPGDPGFLYTLAKHIVSINGKTPANFLVTLELVSRLSALDTRVLRDAFEEKTPGIIPTINTKCSFCGTDIEMGLPISTEFFRPDLRKRGKPVGDAVRPDLPR